MTLRVAVTQEAEGGRRLAELLRDAGFDPVMLPQLAFEPTGKAVRGTRFDLLLATSPRALAFLASTPGGAPRIERVWAVGAATAREAGALGLPIDASVQPGSGAALGALVPQAPPVLDVLVPRGSLGRDEVVTVARGKGHRVEAPVVYRTVPVAYDPERVAAVRHAPPDVLLFTSPSTFRHFVAAFGPEVVGAAKAVGALGATTRAEIEAAGHSVRIQPSRPDLALLVEEVKAFHEQIVLP
jgi:uroporphyrinogen-III synthase